LQAKSDGLPVDTASVPQPKEESRSPHRHRDESWEHYINRRINDEPDADYLARHATTLQWVKRHSLPEDVTQEQYDNMRCEERDRIRMDRNGLLTVHGYLWRNRGGGGYQLYLDSKGRKFVVDDWDTMDRTAEPHPVAIETPYLLHCPRVGQRPELGPDWCGYFLTNELSKLGVMTRDDQMVSLTPIPELEALVGKRVRIACVVEYIREAYYDGDGCYDRVYLAPKEVVEVDLRGYSTEDRKRQEEMFSPRSKARFVDDELDELASEEPKK
jgi:hypothetical protein